MLAFGRLLCLMSKEVMLIICSFVAVIVVNMCMIQNNCFTFCRHANIFLNVASGSCNTLILDSDGVEHF